MNDNLKNILLCSAVYAMFFLIGFMVSDTIHSKKEQIKPTPVYVYCTSDEKTYPFFHGDLENAPKGY